MGPRGGASRATAPRASARPAQGRGRAGSAPSQVQSVRIGDIDRLERQHQARSAQQQKKRRWPIVVGIVAALLVAALIALFALSRSSTFEIKNVEFTGADHLTTGEVSQLVSIPQGTTLLSVDAETIERSLLRDSWVQGVEVRRKFPSTLEVVITEREISAVVSIPVGANQTIQNWAIASDGMWLMAIPGQDTEIGKTLSPKIYEDAAEVLWITDVPYGVTPEIGSYCSDGNVNNALSIVDGMTTELAGQVKTVSATDAESTLLTLDSGIEIAFGTADNIRDKERLCLQIMEQNPTVVYINVRVVDRPTWRAA